MHYFSDFLAEQLDDYDGATTEALEQLLKIKCSEGNKAKLVHEVTTEEIRKVLFDMPANKSPGPDGFNTEFFK